MKRRVREGWRLWIITRQISGTKEKCYTNKNIIIMANSLSTFCVPSSLLVLQNTSLNFKITRNKVMNLSWFSDEFNEAWKCLNNLAMFIKLVNEREECQSCLETKSHVFTSYVIFSMISFTKWCYLLSVNHVPKTMVPRQIALSPL